MHHKFGKTDLETSKIVYGCMGGAGAFGAQEEKDSIEALKTAHDMGINFFDTAEAYGDGYSEQLLGQALGDVRKEIVIASKVRPENQKSSDLIEACNRSLKNLNTDYIDLYMLHWPNHDIPFSESIGALEELKKQGKIRYYGVSNFGREDLGQAMEIGDLSVNQLAYHLLFRAVEMELLPICRDQDIPIVCYSSLMQGLLAGKYRTLDEFPDNRARIRLFDSRKRELCCHGENGAEAEGSEALNLIWKITDETGLSMAELAAGWLKAQPGVGGVLVGTRNAEQSKDLKKLLDVGLSDDVIRALTLATDAVKEKLGPNVDMWEHRIR